MSFLMIKIEVGASPSPPTDAVRELVRVASKIGVWCKATISGIEVLASPNDSEDTLVSNYEAARQRKASFVSANVIPRGVAG